MISTNIQSQNLMCRIISQCLYDGYSNTVWIENIKYAWSARSIGNKNSSDWLAIIALSS